MTTMEWNWYYKMVNFIFNMTRGILQKKNNAFIEHQLCQNIKKLFISTLNVCV